MATVSHDGHTFLVDGRRAWLVSGAIHYPRVPRGLWRSRIRAAKQAGLNCIETYVFWNAHEPSPGRFDFSDNLDLRAFVRTIGEEGMFCIVRPGPFIGAQWDNGGIPPWLSSTEGMKLREGHPAFLEAASRYLQAVMEQMKDLQITELIKPKSVKPTAAALASTLGAGGFTGQGGGPIILMQVENEWFCHNPEVSHKYNDELLRYLREGGCSVPCGNCNNLWQRVDRTIDTWNGSGHLAADLRQLRIVQTDAPRLVTEYGPGWFDPWSGEHAHGVDSDLHLYRLASIAAVGGQANMYMFHGGTNFAFWGGRASNSRDCYITTSCDHDAPLREAGGRGDKYLVTKRLCVFLSQFGHVLAQARPDEQHTTAALNENDHPPAVLQLSGSAGDVVFVLQSKDDARDQIDVMLPNGLTLPVPLGRDRAAWFVLNLPLNGGGELTYTNLRPWAWLGRKVLVLFGPAGSKGLVCLNDSTFAMTVPKPGNDKPLVETHEDTVVVVLNSEQVDSAYVTPTGLVIGATGLDEHDQPIPAKLGAITMIDLAGHVTTHRATAMRKPSAPQPMQWTSANATPLIDGSSDTYKPIDGPTSLEQLGQPHGYGWYRLELKKSPASGKLLAPHMGDRLHLFGDGKPLGVLGTGAGAQWDPLSLKLDKVTTLLCDNLGRMNDSWRVGERKGLFGHVYAVKPLALGKPKIVTGKSPDPFVLRGYVPQRRVDESRAADALVWKVRSAAKKPFVLDFDELPLSGVLFVNDEAFDYYDPSQCARYGRWLLPPHTREIKLALFKPFDKGMTLSKHITLYQCVTNVTESAQWSFTKFAVPDADQFSDSHAVGGIPTWWRCTFRITRTDAPLWLEPVGLTKGQIYLNGHNAGRYFVASPDGKKVTPQERYYLPEPWLTTDADNELILFDEHGAKPTKVRFAYDAMGPYGD